MLLQVQTEKPVYMVMQAGFFHRRVYPLGGLKLPPLDTLWARNGVRIVVDPLG